MTKRTHAMALIRQLCALPVAAEQIAPPLVPMLKDLIDADHLAFAWSGDGGLSYRWWRDSQDVQRRGLHVDRAAIEFTADAIHAVPRWHTTVEIGIGSAFHRNTLAVCTTNGDGQGAALLAACSMSGGSLAFAVLYSGDRALCWLVASRRSGTRPFDDRVLVQLRSLGNSFACIAHRANLDEVEHRTLAWIESGEEGVMLLGPNFESLGASTLATDLVARALGRQDDDDGVSLALNRLLYQQQHDAAGATLRLVGTGDASSKEYTVENAWGRFLIRVTPLLGESGRYVLSIRRQEAEVVGLLRRMHDQPLSPQQREVLIRLGMGMTNLEIAQQLGVTEETAKSHVKQLLQRMGVHDRNEAVALVLQSKPPEMNQWST